jgi:hypothetical protein
VEEFIRRNLLFLSGYDSSSLILKDLTYVLCPPPPTCSLPHSLFFLLTPMLAFSLALFSHLNHNHHEKETMGLVVFRQVPKG